jgi:hypothetical protein
MRRDAGGRGHTRRTHHRMGRATPSMGSRPSGSWGPARHGRAAEYGMMVCEKRYRVGGVLQRQDDGERGRGKEDTFFGLRLTTASSSSSA